MTEDQLLIVQDEYRGLVQARVINRETYSAARNRLDEAKIPKNVTRVVFQLAQTARETLANLSQETLLGLMRRAIDMLQPVVPSNVVTVITSTTSESVSETVSRSETRQIMGDDIRIGGNAINSAVGSAASFRARDVLSYSQALETTSIEPDLRVVLIRAKERLEAMNLPSGDAEDASDDLAKLTTELAKPTKDTGRIRQVFDRFAAIAEPVASLISSAATFAKIYSGNA
jgi:hypothetical protein